MPEEHSRGKNPYNTATDKKIENLPFPGRFEANPACQGIGSNTANIPGKRGQQDAVG